MCRGVLGRCWAGVGCVGGGVGCCGACVGRVWGAKVGIARSALLSGYLGNPDTCLGVINVFFKGQELALASSCLL